MSREYWKAAGRLEKKDGKGWYFSSFGREWVLVLSGIFWVSVEIDGSLETTWFFIGKAESADGQTAKKIIIGRLMLAWGKK